MNHQSEPDTNKPNYIVYTDGGSRGNPGEAAYGFVVYDSERKIIKEQGTRIGINTNNVAEYSAIISALKWVSENSEIENPLVHVFMDSQLATMQLKGIWKIKNENIRNFFFTIKSLEQSIGGKISYTHIPREQNKEADKMVNLALDNKI